MDFAFVAGVVIAFGALYAMITMEGAHLSALFLPAPMILVLGSTIGVGIASHTVKDALSAFGSLGAMVRGPRSTPASVIPILVGYAEKARTEGLLRLEDELDGAPDDYTRRAVQALADGVDAEDLRTVMDDEIATVVGRRRVAAKFFSALGGYAPTIGIVGTVVSLTHVLENLSQPDELGHMIAAAFVATLWGLVSANFIWLPIGARLGRRFRSVLSRRRSAMRAAAGRAGGRGATCAARTAAGAGCASIAARAAARSTMAGTLDRSSAAAGCGRRSSGSWSAAGS